VSTRMLWMLGAAQHRCTRGGVNTRAQRGGVLKESQRLTAAATGRGPALQMHPPPPPAPSPDARPESVWPGERPPPLAPNHTTRIVAPPRTCTLAVSPVSCESCASAGRCSWGSAGLKGGSSSSRRAPSCFKCSQPAGLSGNTSRSRLWTTDRAWG
jgi:hypothetical protein